MKTQIKVPKNIANLKVKIEAAKKARDWKLVDDLLYEIQREYCKAKMVNS